MKNLLLLVLSWAYISMSVEDGLSNPNVTAICHDRMGSLWVGTKNGLNLFENQSFKVFRSRLEDLGSLPDNQVNALSTGPAGQMWVLCQNGLVRYIHQEDRFETVVPEVAFCALNQGESLFVGSSGKLAEVRDGKLYRMHAPFPGREGQSEYGIVCLGQLPGGELLLGTRSAGIFLYRPGASPRLFAASSGNLLIAMYRCLDGSLCVAEYGQGFRRYSPEGALLGHYTSKNSNLSNDYIQAFAEYRSQLWMATDGGGICIQTPGEDRFKVLRAVVGDPDSLPSNSITTLHVDSQGTLWAGTVKHGFFQVRESHIRSLSGYARGLQDNAVISLYREGDKLWVGTDGGGVHFYDPATKRFRLLPHSRGKILSIAGFGPRHLLVSVYMEGFFLLDRQSGNLSPFVLVDAATDRAERYSGSLHRAGKLPWGPLCFAGGPSWLYHHGGGFEPLRMSGGETAPRGMFLATADSARALLFKDSHVFELSARDNLLRPLFSAGIHEQITALALDGDTVWVGTSRSLGRYDIATGTYHPLVSSLFDDVSALEWADGKLWICARNALFTYIPEEGRFVSWSESDGFRPSGIKMLYQNERDPAFVYLGGSGGLVEIERRTPLPSRVDPEIFLERLYVNGELTPWSGSVGKLRLPWKSRQVSASFQVKDEVPFLGAHFRYSVRGHRSWTYDSDESRLSLPSLEPGDYEVLVSCLTKAGVYSQPRTLLSLTILPPWYRSKWFAVACILLLLSGLALLLRYLLLRQENESKNAMALFLEEVLQEEDVPDSESDPAATDPEFRAKLDKLIMDNLSDPDLGIKFLTDRLPLSRTGLYNKVKEVTGMGVKDYINRMRIERSVELLLTTHKTINEIAYEVGFAYPRYFSTSFKSLKGVTPTAFKKENRHE